MERTNHNNINKFNQSTYFGLLVGEQKSIKIGVARQTITISTKWLNENLGIENVLLGVDNSNIHTVKLYQNLVFDLLQIKVKMGYL
jgi:hypothetical protein